MVKPGDWNAKGQAGAEQGAARANMSLSGNFGGSPRSRTGGIPLMAGRDGLGGTHGGFQSSGGREPAKPQRDGTFAGPGFDKAFAPGGKAAASGTRVAAASPVLRALVIDSDEQVRTACRGIAERIGFRMAEVSTAGEARAILQRQPFDLLLLDIRAREEDGGQSLLEEVRSLYPKISIVVMTAFATVSSAVEAMRTGAGDYLTKPFSQEELTAVLDRAAQKQHIDRESRLLRERLQTAHGMGDMVGQAPEMEKLYRILSKVAYSTHPVLILGESGTGKELVARSIHVNGPNHAKPFVAVDCGSLVPTLIETELFGYIRGAFTGADRAKEGLLAAADGGTVFLDEIGELPLDLQSKLLRALQEKEIRPVGATYTVPISARILAATNRNLQAMVGSGKFRKDLYFRLNVVSLKIPPLRERREDIPTLALHFLDRMNTEGGKSFSFTDDALRSMISYNWPGNVRELENAIERAFALSSGPLINTLDLPTQLQDFLMHERAADAEAARLAEEHGLSGQEQAQAKGGILSIADMEKRAILETIQQLKGDKLLAAKLLGIGKTTLYRKLKEYGITEAGEEGN